MGGRVPSPVMMAPALNPPGCLLGTARARGTGAALGCLSLASPQPARGAAAEAALVESRSFAGCAISEEQDGFVGCEGGGIPSAWLWNCPCASGGAELCLGGTSIWGGTGTKALLSPLMGAKGWAWAPSAPLWVLGLWLPGSGTPCPWGRGTNPSQTLSEGLWALCSGLDSPTALKDWRALALLTPT